GREDLVDGGPELSSRVESGGVPRGVTGGVLDPRWRGDVVARALAHDRDRGALPATVQSSFSTTEVPARVPDVVLGPAREDHGPGDRVDRDPRRGVGVARCGPVRRARKSLTAERPCG